MLDGDTLNLVISSVYDAGLDDGHWPAALARLTEAFGAAFGAVLLRSSDLREVEGRAAGVDPLEYQGFLRRHFRTSPFHRRMPVWQTGAVIRNFDHMPFDVLRRTAMYQEFWRPHRLHDVLRLNIAALPGGHIHYLNLIRRRGEPNFGATEVGLAHVLIPHLQKASAIRSRLGALSLQARDALSALDTLPQAMLLLRGDGLLLHANRRTEADTTSLVATPSRLRKNYSTATTSERDESGRACPRLSVASNEFGTNQSCVTTPRISFFSSLLERFGRLVCRPYVSGIPASFRPSNSLGIAA